MKQGRLVFSLLTVLLVGACSAKTSEDLPGKEPGNAVEANDKDIPVVKNDSQKTVVKPPSPSSVLYLIFQKDGDGASSYEVENGSWATYWYGYSFDLGGKHYFTGFASQTPDKYGKSEEENNAAPDAKVTLTQATLFTTTPDAEKPWTFQGSERFIGEFGSYEKANEIDETREPQSHQTPSGKLLLAVPTWYLVSGTRVSSFDMFVFNPDELTKVDERRWTYLGNVVAGEDNGAACDDEAGAVLPCVKSTGVLSFIAQEGADLPLIRMAMSGTEIVSAGKTRSLGPEDNVEYRYDSTKKQYQ
jgi:hypothetical protein